ncbi:hypothetical protein JW823_09580 [bacterium]|nr:hypothetical protein [candidate division CSSED10-310 bacterium]
MKVIISKISILFLFVMIAISVCISTSQAQVGMDSFVPTADSYRQRPMFAQFLSSDILIEGNETGLTLFDIKTNQNKETYLAGISICSMMANPHQSGQVLVGAENGDVYLCQIDAESLSIKKLEAISNSSLHMIKSILFHRTIPGKVLFADDTSIAFCRLSEESLTIERVVTLDTKQDFIVFLFPDNLSTDAFLISASSGGRYRGNWETGKIEDMPESVIEYGYQVKKKGVSYFPRGKNQEILNIKFINAQPTFILQHPTQSNVFLASTIGVSPLRITIDDRNHYDLDYFNENSFLTFSIDVDRNNVDRIIFSTEKRVFFSEDGGSSWRVLGK